MIGTCDNNIIIPSVEVTDVDDVNNNNMPPPPAPPPIVLETVVGDVPQILDYPTSPDQDNANVFCECDVLIDLTKVPISAMRPKTRQRLSNNLNTSKVLLSEEGVQRDWRGVHHYLRLELTLGHFQSKGGDYMDHLLTEWEKERPDACSLGELRYIMGQIDRWDVVDDTTEMFGNLLHICIHRIMIAS